MYRTFHYSIFPAPKALYNMTDLWKTYSAYAFPFNEFAGIKKSGAWEIYEFDDFGLFVVNHIFGFEIPELWEINLCMKWCSCICLTADTTWYNIPRATFSGNRLTFISKSKSSSPSHTSVTI